MAKNIEIDPSRIPNGSDLDPLKGRSVPDATVSSGEHASVTSKESSAGHKVSTADSGMSYPTAGYYGYYYPGYDGYSAESDGQLYVPEIQYPMMQADTGSFYYLLPGSGYNGCDQQLPIGTGSADGQYFGQQIYATSPVLSPTMASPGIFPTNIPYGSEMVLPSYSWDSSYMAANGLQRNDYVGVPGGYGVNQLKLPNKGSHRSSAFQSNDLLTKGYQYHVPKYPFHHQKKGGVLYSSHPANSKGIGKLWGSSDKTKVRSKPNIVGDLDHINEQKYESKVPSIKGSVDRLSLDGNGTGNDATTIRRDQFNLPNFVTKYDQALFFVIKSYSEDDIHKSIKYNVWASTPSGNKRLDSAYQSALEKAKAIGNKCPVFLFFSVNASGQFCGVAEMVGRVNFDKSMDFWQQDKWNGYFPVKWHIIKDVPNPQLRHIILENNDNKPVTNSRDTQEVLSPQGIAMLEIFKTYALKTSILDDFGFYENRQKIMQNRKKTPPASHLDHGQKQVHEITSSISSIDLHGCAKPMDQVAGNMGKE